MTASLQKAGRDHTATLLNFEALSAAVKTAATSVALGQALHRSPDAAVQVDDEERRYVRELLAEQMDLAADILAVEEDVVETKLRLRAAKDDLAREYSYMCELYPGLTGGDDGGEGEKAADPKSRLGRKRAALKAEEARLDQMK